MHTGIFHGRRGPVTTLLFAAWLAAVSMPLAAEDLAPLRLPAPDTTGGRPLMQVLKDRQSARSFSARKLPEQELANLLWAAFGVNRPDSGKRTAPSAVDWREISLYVALEQGLYLYDADQHILTPVLGEDLRGRAGSQPFVKDAPVVLILVADFARMEGADEANRTFYSAADAGFISQNVYLFCASERLATVVLGWVDKPALAKAMGLRPDQRVIFSQPVGYPAE